MTAPINRGGPGKQINKYLIGNQQQKDEQALNCKSQNIDANQLDAVNHNFSLIFQIGYLFLGAPDHTNQQQTKKQTIDDKKCILFWNSQQITAQIIPFSVWTKNCMQAELTGQIGQMRMKHASLGKKL